MSNNDLLFDLLQQIDIDDISIEEEEERSEILAKTAQKARIEQRRAERLQDCGNWSYWYNPHNGKRTGFTFKCGLFRECSACLERRAEDERGWLQNASLAKSLNILRVPKERATKLLRRKEKADYVRYPQENGVDLLIFSDELELGGVAIDFNWVRTQDWAKIVNTPEGRKKSGSVHMPASDEDMNDFTLITTKQFTTNANRPQVLEAMQEAEECTSELDPKTPDEVVEALNKRTNIATNLLEKEGFNVQVYEKRLRVWHDQIDWQEENGLKLRVNTNINTLSNESIEVNQFESAVNSPLERSKL